MKKLFLTVLSFLIPVSLSYGDAPITGTLTITQTIECGYWSYSSEDIPFNLKVGNKVGNESRGYFAFFFASEESTNVFATVTGSDNCEGCYVTTYCTNGYGAEWNLGSQNGCYVTTTSDGVNEIGLIFGITPTYYYSAYWSGYCTECYNPPLNIKYRIYDLYNSYDEEFILSEGLTRDVNFLSAAPDGDLVQYKFSGKKGDSVTVNATITNFGSIAEENWGKPGIDLQRISYYTESVVSSTEQVLSSSSGILTDTLSVDGDYYITVHTPSYSGYQSHTASGCNSISGSVPVHITVTAKTASSLVVNSTGDASDIDVTDGACNTGKTTAGGDLECTLRAAMEETNARTGENTITFLISGGTSAKTASAAPLIRPKKKLPVLKEAETIDGTTQPGGKVELDGINVGLSSGLSFSGTYGTVKGMIIKNFSGDGIYSAGEIAVEDVEILDNHGFGINAVNTIDIFTSAKVNRNEDGGIFTQHGSILAASIQSLEVVKNEGTGIWSKNEGSVVTLENVKINRNKGNGIKMDGSLTIYGTSNQINNNGGTGISNIGAVTDGREVEIEGIEILNNKGRGIYSTASVIITKQAKINENKKEGIWCEGSFQAGGVDFIEVIGNKRAGIKSPTPENVITLENAKINKNKGSGISMDGSLTIYGTSNQINNNNGSGISNSGEDTDGRETEIDGIEMLNNNGWGIFSTPTLTINNNVKINKNEKGGIWCKSSVLAGGVDSLEVSRNGGHGIVMAGKGEIATLKNIQINKNQGKGLKISGDLTANQGDVCGNNSGDIETGGVLNLTGVVYGKDCKAAATASPHMN